MAQNMSLSIFNMLDTRHKHEKSLLINDFYYLFYIGAVEQLVNLISVYVQFDQSGQLERVQFC